MDTIIRLSYREVDINTVSYLLRHQNIHVDSIISVEGWITSFLIFAVVNSDEKLVKYIISRNPNVNLIINGKSPLSAAAEVGNIRIFRQLHNLGANINFIDQRGHTLLSIAALCNNKNVVDYLIQHHLVYGLGPNTDVNLLECACAINFHPEIIKFILNNNTDININQKGTSSKTALTHALRNGDLSLVKLLISRGADINKTQLDKFTVLKFDHSIEMMDYLLSFDEEFTDVNHIDKDGRSLLHHSSLNSHFEGIDSLLNAGADVNRKDLKGQLVVELEDAALGEDFINLKIKYHIVKLMAAGLLVCEKNQRAVEGNFEDLRVLCHNEIKILNNNNIGDSNIKFFDVLRMSVHYLAIRLKYTSFVVDKEKLEKKYAAYSRMLFFKLTKVQRRITYLGEVEKFIDGILCKSGLPYYFVRDLWYYFSNIQLKKLVMQKNNRIDKFL